MSATARGLVDTGHSWLGSIPRTWKLAPLGTVFRERKVTVSDSDFEPLSVSMGGVVPRMDNVALTANNDARKLVRAGDYVINSRSDRKGSGGIAPTDGSVSVISTVLHPVGIYPRFAHHLLRSTAFQEEFYRWGSGIVADLWSTRYQAMRRITLPLPPLSEQRLIADFLDRETGKIDALIDKQTELITRLHERRVALVVRATTTGNEEAELVESGIYWAGRIPVNWGERPLKRIFTSVQAGVWGDEAKGDSNDISCIRVADFDRPRLRVGEAPTVRNVSRQDRHKCGVFRGDLLIEKSGGTGINPVGFVVGYDADVPAVCANFIARIRPRKDQLTRYWLYALFGSYASGLTWKSVKQTTGIQNLDMGAFFSEHFPVPSATEQQRVVEYLDRETARLDELIGKTERMIGLSRERRSALITAAVTGQIDVNEHGGAA